MNWTSEGLAERILRTRIGRSYECFQRRALELEAPGIPEPVSRNFVNLAGFETIEFIRRLVDSAHTVLVVGDAFAREYFALRSLGKQVVVLDIAPQRALSGFVRGDVSRPLPFRDGSFDAIVLSEVLEHLVHDHAALLFLRRVLKDEGRLVLSVPFVHDKSEYHVRVHTPLTVERLLRAAGFRPVLVVQRGGLIVLDKPWFKALLHLINWLALRVSGRVLYKRIFSAFANVDWRLGVRGSRLLRMTSAWGGYVLAVKGESCDFAVLNAEEFAFGRRGRRLAGGGS